MLTMNLSLILTALLVIFFVVFFVYLWQINKKLEKYNNDQKADKKIVDENISDLVKKTEETYSLCKEFGAHIKEFQAHNKMTDILLTKIKTDISQFEKNTTKTDQ